MTSRQIIPREPIWVKLESEYKNLYSEKCT